MNKRRKLALAVMSVWGQLTASLEAWYEAAFITVATRVNADGGDWEVVWTQFVADSGITRKHKSYGSIYVTLKRIAEEYAKQKGGSSTAAAATKSTKVDDIAAAYLKSIRKAHGRRASKIIRALADLI